MHTPANNAKDFPLIKEVHAYRILQALILFKQNPLDRDAQRDGILKLYNEKEKKEKEEKSVFRGMIIPSFRKLGFLQGWEDMISLSANGLIIAEAGELSIEYGMRALRALVLEKDREYLSIVETGIMNDITMPALYERLRMQIPAPSDAQRHERLKRWITLLCNAKLIEKTDMEHLSVVQTHLKIACSDLDSPPKAKGFRIFYSIYMEN